MRTGRACFAGKNRVRSFHAKYVTANINFFNTLDFNALQWKTRVRCLNISGYRLEIVLRWLFKSDDRSEAASSRHGIIAARVSRVKRRRESFITRVDRRPIDVRDKPGRFVSAEAGGPIARR